MLRDTPKAVYLKDYKPPEFLIDKADLRFELGEQRTLVFARLEMRRNPRSTASGEMLYLHGEGLELLALSINGQPLTAEEYVVETEGLRISGVPARFIFESTVCIKPQENTALEGLYKSGTMFCTQCEAEGFRKITWFIDRPDVMTRFTTTIVADKAAYPVLLSNGNTLSREDIGDGKHQVVWDDPFPKPSYLFALVAGNLRYIEDGYTTASCREILLRIYIEPENIEKCDHAMRSLKSAMAWDERNYGREYDLDIFMIVAVNDFNMGAMENKGLNIFNSKFVLAQPETATDWDFQGIKGVIAHEYFHNWTGNRITCRDWFQLSLKEGLTVFRDQEFSADMGSPGVKRIEDVRLLRGHQFSEDSGPMAHPVRPESYIEINNFYTVTVYEKGAEVVRMLHSLLGPEAYREAIDLYFQRHDGEAVTTDDFVCCMAQSSGRDLTQFKRWYSQAGTPELRVSGEYDATSESYLLSVEQLTPATPGQPDKKPLHLPLAVGLLNGQGQDIALRLKGEDIAGPDTRVLELTDTRQSFHFVDIPQRPVPSLLRGFSAPVKLIVDYSDADLMFLMANDSDGFNRWDAAQSLLQRVLLRRISDARTPLPEGFVEVFRRTLSDPEAEKALLAEMLMMPSESYLGDQLAQVDVDGIHQSREGLLQLLANELQPELMQLYHANLEQGGYDIEPASIARRSLKNLCLGYLMQLRDDNVLGLCVEQYRHGHNMTDVMAALSLVADSDVPERSQLLADFYRRWNRDQLVLDKWFAVQAVSKRTDALEQVKALTGHPDFSITNPNRVRSLVGAFCSGNPVRFHRADGAGYRFLADRVLELDRLNPQVASRMLRLMTRWRRFDEPRQYLMREQLERVLAADQVSRDIYEIGSKSLES